MFGQLVYALFQQNWDNDVVIGHLTAQQSAWEEERKMRWHPRGGGGGLVLFDWAGHKTKENKSISGGK